VTLPSIVITGFVASAGAYYIPDFTSFAQLCSHSMAIVSDA
jgi:hypothetical protein